MYQSDPTVFVAHGIYQARQILERSGVHACLQQVTLFQPSSLSLTIQLGIENIILVVVFHEVWSNLRYGVVVMDDEPHQEAKRRGTLNEDRVITQEASPALTLTPIVALTLTLIRSHTRTENSHEITRVSPSSHWPNSDSDVGWISCVS